ncbi:MAG: hypothetical protein JRC87_10230 [Deltaproteobacteria bacterium]|nr:hypothetical protein [Deltaproteobacteria bacterium]
MPEEPFSSNFSGDDNPEERAKDLCQEISVAAGAGDFPRADLLRNELIKSCPMALKEIIGSAEVIENERAAGIDNQHLAVWDHLYKDLSQEEKNCLFYSMRRAKVPPKKVLLSAGSYNARLFFIDRGKVVIISSGDGKKKSGSTAGQGAITGGIYLYLDLSLFSNGSHSH